MYDETGSKESLDSLLDRTTSHVWGKSLSNELARLAQGLGDIKGNDAVDYIHKLEVPADRIVTYANFICDYRPLKSDPHCVRPTVGGDKLPYPDEVASPAALLLETKLIFNSTISDAHKGARFLTLDIKDFFLQTYMKRAEYMRIHSKYFLDDIRQKYGIDFLVAEDGYVYCKI